MARVRFSAWSWGYVIIVSKFVLLFIDSGIAKSFGVLIPTMVERLDSDYATVGLICSLPATLLYLLCPFVALVLPKTNHRFVAMLGGVLCGSCIIACAFFKNTVTVGVCLTLSGAGLSMTYLPITLALNDFFQEKFLLVSTITVYGYTAGSMLLPIVIERSLQAYGYAGVFIILGGITLNLVVCGAAVRKAPTKDDTNGSGSHSEVKDKHKCHSGEKERGKDEEEDSEESISEQRRLIQYESRWKSKHEISPNTRLSWVTSFFQICKGSCGLLNERLFLFSIPIIFLQFYTIYAWMLFLVSHAEHLGVPPSKAIYLSTVGGIGGIIGRTFFIILVGKGISVINVFVFYIAIALICTGSFLLDFVSSAYEVCATLAFVQGFSFFIEDTITASLCKYAILDDKNFKMALALSNFTGGLGATCAGTLTGYLFEVTQSFTKVFIILGFIHAAMVVHLFLVAILIKRRR